MSCVTTAELQLELQNLAQGLGISVQELLANYVDLNTYQIDTAAINTTLASYGQRLDAIDVIDANDNVVTLAEKVKALNDMFTQNGNLATDVLNRIAANATAIASETTRATAAEAALASRLDTDEATLAANTTAINGLSQTVTANKTASDAAVAGLDSRVAADEAAIAKLNGDSTVAGSVAKTVADAVSAEATRAQGVEAGLQTAVDGINVYA